MCVCVYVCVCVCFCVWISIIKIPIRIFVKCTNKHYEQMAHLFEPGRSGKSAIHDSVLHGFVIKISTGYTSYLDDVT